MRTANALPTLWLLVLLIGGIRGQELPNATAEFGAFGLTDLSGARLLTAPDLPQPAKFHSALCSDGGRYPIRFQRRQAEREGHHGRQTRYTFDKLAGNVFTVLRGTIKENVSCFVASDRMLSSATVIPLKQSAVAAECGAELERRLAAARSRDVVHCWPIAVLPGDDRLVLVQFARRDKDALASVAWIDRGQTFFADYPAGVDGEGQEVWRAGDGGVLSAEGFRIVFLLKRGAFSALGVNWMAEEGASLAVFISNGGDRFTKVIQDYWYYYPL
jgi:hypothetical protein